MIGVDDAQAERTPAEKVAAVRLEGEKAATIMVGDGIHDAPALAAAGVGVALGSRGSSTSSEAADVVISVDRLDRVGDAVAIARRARRIAAQSALAGIGLSVMAMAAAAFGQLPPVWGAVLQEAIDVLVILNALRALRGSATTVVLTPPQVELARRFEAEHERLAPDLDRIRQAADQIGTAPPTQALAATRDAVTFLTDDLQPHEEAEETDLYPAMASALGGVDPMGAMTRSHVEIAHLIRRLRQLLGGVDPDAPSSEDLIELRRVLYGLDAILRLHFAQEDERYLSLADDGEPGT